MRKFIAILFLLVAIGLYFFLFLKPNINVKNDSSITPTTTSQPIPTGNISHNTLFVPYWSSDTIASGYKTYIYFSIKPSSTGIDTLDSGYAGIPAFVAATQGNKTLLTVSMLSNDTTSKILQDVSLQENVIQDTLQAVQAYGFDGVVLDLEYNGLAFDSVTKSITDFSTRFANEVKARNLLFYQTMYGDTFYLGRPYHVGEIAKNTDGIFVLAYDFHKANGTPGPNFPLLISADSDYSFEDMVTDFSKNVPASKLTIVFGMFGYDWTVDDKNRPEKAAESFSDIDIQKKFLNKCAFENCKILRDNQSQEPSITYTDTNGEKHVVWFEDMTSIALKEQILKAKGISNVGFWANGYF